MPPNPAENAPHNPNEYLQIPDWITADYFRPILESKVPNFRSITNFNVVAATAPGENFTSVMVRIFVEMELRDGTMQKSTYILKTGLQAGSSAELIASMSLFPKEQQMYQKILPKYEELYRKAGMDVRFGPQCLHVEETPDRITLIMEDLGQQGYKNVDRLQGLNMEHMLSTLKKLAEFHAASAVHYELYGPFDEMFSKSFFCPENRSFFMTIGQLRKEAFKSAMSGWGFDDAEYFINKIPSIDDTFDATLFIFSSDSTEFNVLNHGDFWVNNMMFNYKHNGDLNETRFVDYQIGKWGSPAQDLWYLIVTSPSLDIKLKHFDYFLRFYHTHLVECLKKLNYRKPLPTLKTLHIMMLKYGYWGAYAANIVLPVMLIPTDKDSNIDSFMKPGPEGDEHRARIFSNPLYATAMRQLYPFLDNKGLLEVP